MLVTEVMDFTVFVLGHSLIQQLKSENGSVGLPV